MKKPIQLDNINLERLKKACQECLDFYEAFDYENADEDRQGDYWTDIQEAAMEAVFGDKVHNYINTKT